MAERTWIQDLPRHVGAEISISGWVRFRRSSGKIHFLEIRDGSGSVQAVVRNAALYRWLYGEEQAVGLP